MDTIKTAPRFAFSNPFLSSSPLSPFPTVDDEVPADAPEGSYAYALVKSAPPVPAEECEVDASSVEVLIRWGDTLLHVAHLTPPRSFYVGEPGGGATACDFSLPAERLGALRSPVVLVGPEGAVHAALPRGAEGAIEIGDRKMTVAEARSSGQCAPCAEVDGAMQIALPMGGKAKIGVGGFTFEISVGRAGRPVAGRIQVDSRSLPFTALSTVLHLGLLGMMAVFMPPLAMADEGGVTSDQRYMMSQALSAIAERELTEAKNDSAATNPPADAQGGSGARSIGEEGKAGSTASTKTGGRWDLAGPKDNAEVRISRDQALRDAADFGMIGVLRTGLGGDPSAIRAPWGGLETLGNGERNVLGNMWGPTVDEAGGAGGLGLAGVGEGGGGRFSGVGMGFVGTINHGAGLGDGQGFGPGHGGSSFISGRGHQVSSPRMTIGSTTVTGRIPAEVIQRIVRQNFGRFRLCYEGGLRNNPSLSGRVGVAFVIGRDGAVSSVQNGGSDMPDASVVSCVVRSFYGLSFPPPEGGIVTVSYPIVFTPGGS